MKFESLVVLLLLVGFRASFGQNGQSLKDNEHDLSVMDKGLIKISIMYPYAEGKRFDIAYYETSHMPMVAGLLGSNLVKYTIEKGVASGIPNTLLPFMAIGTFYVKSLSDYQSAISPNRDSIRSDFSNYTDVTPIILISEVIR